MGATVDIHRSILSPVEERWASNLVPHLSGHHGEAEEYSCHRPHLLVVQELQVVATEVQEPGY